MEETALMSILRRLENHDLLFLRIPSLSEIQAVVLFETGCVTPLRMCCWQDVTRQNAVNVEYDPMQTTEQADLADRLLADDEAVLGEVLRAFGPMVLGVMCRRYRGVLPQTDIEDAVSIGLFRLWDSRSRFDRGKASLKVWFFRIVENAIRDVLRHGWHKARLLEVAADEMLHDAFPQVSDRHKECNHEGVTPEPTNLQLDLREIIGSLPEMQRRIVAADAATRDGTANSTQLADELQIPSSTVRVYRKRAMDRIRRELTQRGHDVPQP